MALITRFTRLFSADLHAVLDRVEEPEILLKQAIRDMQAAVAAAEGRIASLDSRRRQIGITRADAARRLNAAAEELDVCLDAGNDDLARSVIQRKLELERRITALDAEAEHISQSLSEQQQAVAERRRELDALRSQAQAYDPAPGATHAPQPAAVSVEEVEVALLREKQRRSAS